MISAISEIISRGRKAAGAYLPPGALLRGVQTALLLRRTGPLPVVRPSSPARLRPKTRPASLFLTSLLFLAGACGPGPREGENAGGQVLTDSTRIVSLNGTVSEIVAALGLERNIVGTDVTSTYPASLREKPKVGHNRNISAEGVLSLRPDLVLGTQAELNEGLRGQFEAAGSRVIVFEQEHTGEGARRLIRQVADSLGLGERAEPLVDSLNSDLDAARRLIDTTARPKVLFIYARGTGTMMVAGEGTPVEQIIELAGGRNAVEGFEDYKPLTSESLVAANPDVILLFHSGLESLGGMEGLLKIQGIAQTNAGKNRKVVEMDGQLLTGFGPRLGRAVGELAAGIR